MSTSARNLICFLLGGLAVLSSCGSGAERDPASRLVGKWVLEHAYRNGQATESLDELYFEFYADGQMNTNLTGKPEAARYEVDDGLIRQVESDLDAVYRIEDLADSTLVLSTTLRNYAFRFHLQRQAQLE